jgi:hypothetical protein
MQAWARARTSQKVGRIPACNCKTVAAFAIVFSLFLALIIIPQSRAQAQAPAQECENDLSASVPDSGEGRCIAGVRVNTRARVASACLLADKALQPDAIYAPSECGGSSTRVQAEFIAQARYIAQMNKDLKGPADGIKSDIQWEVSFKTLRPDIIAYNPKDSTTPISIYEVKGSWDPDGVKKLGDKIADDQDEPAITQDLSTKLTLS